MASLAASLLDWLVSIALVSVFGIGAIAAGVSGTLCGGVFHFLTGRNWVFGAAGQQPSGQALRYLLVWAGYLALSACGLYVLTAVAGAGFVVSKLSVSLLLAIGYNYPLQKRYVFKNNKMI